jgi:methionyl-tRNA formyltransferase
MRPVRILFAGSPAIAVPSLETLVRLSLEDNRFSLAGLLTNPDSRRGRSGRTEPTETGAALDLLTEQFTRRSLPPPVQLKPENLDAAAREAVAARKPDLLISFAYGRIFGPKFLALFPLGGINIHPSLLPKYRGATPIPAAILGRDRETGITIQRLATEMDAGEILVQEPIPLTGRETTASLGDIAAAKGAELLPALLGRLSPDKLTGRRQNNTEASYCGLLRKEDGLIHWSSAAADIDARIRAYTPWPLSWTFHDGELLYILEGGDLPSGNPPSPGAIPPGTVLGVDKDSGILVQTGDGIFAIRRLQYRTKKVLSWRDFLNGARDFIDAQLNDGGSDQNTRGI